MNTVSEPAQPADLTDDERRRDKRKPVIKSAKIIINHAGSVLNCFVVDESAGGVQVDLAAIVELPDHLTIQFSTGATYLARRAWAAGTRAGLQFTSGQLVDDDTVARMHKIAELLHSHGLATAVQTLRKARFFDNAELRRAAEEAEAAAIRFETMLHA